MGLSAWFLYGIVALASFILLRRLLGSSKGRLPPGPKPIPILGNIRDFPPDGAVEHLHWLKHKDLYGGVSSVTVMGMTLVLIHDKKAAHELLDQASVKTSGRPAMVMANKLCGYESIVLCQGYNPTFRRYRKYLHRELGTPATAANFRDSQSAEVNRQLIRALNRPEEWLTHLKTTSAATILKMAYGYTIEPHKPDFLVELIEQALAEFSLAAVPMAWAVDIVPALQYLPNGIPGVKFKETAHKWRKTIQAAAYIPYQFVRGQMASFTHRPSYVSKLVQELTAGDNGRLSSEDELAIVWTAASLYGAAAESSVITLKAFTLAMVKFPCVQQKAQEEIDRVVGIDRLPNFDDRADLPYVVAMVKELIRWWPVAPLGFPHVATEDVEYEGMHIPKGAVLLPAAWWFLQDPDVYKDPGTFDPERFLEPRTEPDPTTEAFGYGRRICPGRYFADSSLFINIVRTLASFHFSKATGTNELEVKPKPGVLTHPAKFDFQIKPRSDKHVDLIRQLDREQQWEAGDAEHLDSLDSFEVKY